MKRLHLGAGLTGGGVQKIFKQTSEVFLNENGSDYIAGISEQKLDVNFSDIRQTGKILKFFNIIFSYKNYKILNLFLYEKEIDLVHLHSFNGVLSPSVLLALKNQRVVQTLHEYQIICPNSSLYSYSRNSICEKCIGKKYKYDILKEKCAAKGLFYTLGKFICYLIFDKLFNQKERISHFIVPSEFTKVKMVQDGIPEEKITIVHNPVEVNFKVDDFSEKEDIIVYFGRFTIEKNVEFLIEVFEKITKKRDGLKLYLVGKGDQLERYKVLILRLNLGDKVVIKEFLSTAELKEVLKKSKISVMTSKCYETFGLTIIESIYARVYPLARNIGAMKDNIEKNVGRVFETQEELQEIILEILDNYEKYQSEINKNYKEIIKKYSLENYREELKKVYKKVLSGDLNGKKK